MEVLESGGGIGIGHRSKFFGRSTAVSRARSESPFPAHSARQGLYVFLTEVRSMCTRRSRVLLWSPALKPIVTGHCHCKSSGFGCLFWTVICLDPEPVWIHDEGGVVVGAVNRTQTGHTIVVPACGYRCRVKGIDGGSIRCRKAEVETRLFVGWNRTLGLDNPERDAIAAISVAH